jgi:hypothetical protein
LFWGLRLYLICTPTGMPIMWALADAKIGEREAVQGFLAELCGFGGPGVPQVAVLIS